jgi:hypothetical protein
MALICPVRVSGEMAFTARNYKEARTLFDEALRYYGDVPEEEIYKAVVRFAALEKEPEMYPEVVFSYLKPVHNSEDKFLINL